MTAEEYIEQKATITYSGGMNAVKIIAEEYALSAIDLAKKQMVDKACKWIEYYNNNGGCLFDSWKDDFVKAMEK